MSQILSDIQKAADLLKQGKLVAFPTETVYGLGASVFLPEAIKKLFQVKGRPQDNPLIVHISDLNQLSMIVRDLPDKFDLLAKAFFPGPLTVLLPKSASVPGIVSANLPTIGVRMPAHPVALQLINAVGVPIVAPSANLSGKPSSTTAQHVLADFRDTIAGVLDGGPCHYGIESTVITLNPTPLILRPGAISEKQLEQVLNCPVFFIEKDSDKPLSPGMKYKHYAPQAKVLVFYSKKDCDDYMQRTPYCQRLFLTHIKPSELYSLFRKADDEQQEEIVILCDEQMQKNKALMNRIDRSCS